ncbi:MAG: AAA family ATPase [Xenococcaceae cyanobacterium]
MSGSLTQQHQLWQQLTPAIGVGLPVPEGWLPIATQPLLIIVGVTGVGKSTTTAALAEEGLSFTLLPNRRTLSDQLIISKMAKENRQQGQTLCRIERLKYTRQYREQFPGGMAHILDQLQVNPEQVNSLLIFDGLRGENEVSYAVTALAKAKFVLLDAPDWVRLQRLLSRNDSFDQIAKPQLEGENVEVEPEALTSFAALGVPEASTLFTSTEKQEFLALARKGIFTTAELHDKLKIVVEERRNYNSVATQSALLALAPERTLVIDTTTHTPQQVAKMIVASLKSD